MSNNQIKYTVISNGDKKNLVAFIDGEMYQATDENPVWGDILVALANNDPKAASLFSPARAVDEKFRAVSERVSLRGSTVYFDNVPQGGVLVDHIVRFLEEGHDFTALVNFMEKVSVNPNEHSREQLYRWLTATNGFSITNDGDVIGYKGVNSDGNGGYKSSNSGNAIVDGVEVSGCIPNNPGSTIEMPRDEVQHDPSVGCHKGLHVGTWDYARNFASVVLEVRVNPRDVVSVPTDCSDAKMRTCRYQVVDVVTEPYSTALVAGLETDDNFDYDDDYDDDSESGWDNYVSVPESSVVHSIELLSGTNGTVLCVTLNSGRSYHYKNVPRSVYNDFVAAHSKGNFYNTQIKGKYTESGLGH